MIISLNGAWRGEGFSPDGKRISFAGHVPGCVHGDLMRQGMLEDPFWRDNAAKSRWIETWNWAYEREFQAEEAWTNALIEFDGLDTYCQVFLNGVEIGSVPILYENAVAKAVYKDYLRKIMEFYLL